MDNYEEVFKSYYDFLNYLYSINFTMLENQRHNFSQNNNIRNFDSIYEEKGFLEQYLDREITCYAKQRAKNFCSVDNELSSNEWKSTFEQSADSLIFLYNSTFHQSIKKEDLFSNGRIKDFDLLEKVFGDIPENIVCSAKDQMTYQYAVVQFSMFYQQYKKWLAIKELIDVLDSDLNENGSKNFYYGIHNNNDIKLIPTEELYKIKPILKQTFSQNNKNINKNYAKIEKICRNNYEKDSDEYDMLCKIYTRLTEENACISLALDTVDMLIARSRAANTNISDFKSSAVDFLLSLKSGFPKSKFIIDKIYAHRFEIDDILNAFDFVPQLNNYKNIIFDIFEDENVNIPQKS